MRLVFFFGQDLISSKQAKELFQNEFVLVLDCLANGLGSQKELVFFEHAYQSLDLLLVLFSNLFVAFDLKLQTFCLVNPVNPLGPGNAVVGFLEDFMKLLLGGSHFLLLGIYDQVIIFCQDWDQRILFLLHAPRELLQKAEQFVLIDCVSFSQATHINDCMQRYGVLLQFSQYFLSNVDSVIYFIQTRYVKNAKSNLLACDLKCGSVIKVHVCGDFLQAVGHLD